MTDLTDIRNDALQGIDRSFTAYRAKLQAMLEEIQGELDWIDENVRHLREGGPGGQPEGRRPGGIDEVYARQGPQAAIESFFRNHEDSIYKPSALAKELRRLGCRPATTNPNAFVAQVRTSCLRLVDKAILEQAKAEGKVAFRLRHAEPRHLAAADRATQEETDEKKP